MADSGEGGRENEASSEPANDAESEQKVPVSRADAEKELGEQEEYGASEDEVARSESVEDGADLQPGEKGEEGVYTKDPAYGARGGGLELMRGEIGLVRAEGVHHAKGGHEPAERAEDTEVGLQAAFGVGVTVGVCGDAAGACERVVDVLQSWRLRRGR